MAKRRASGGGEMNLDSLLDTLTNVVGVLVMVLMLTSLNVRSAVERILDLDPTQLAISADDLKKAEKQAEDAKLLRESLAAKMTSVSVTKGNENFGELLQKIETLKKAADVPALTPEQLAALRTAAREREDQNTKLSQQFVSIEDELAKLKALLDTTEAVAAPAAKIVSLPFPREAPATATQYRVIVRDGKIVPFNPTAIRDRCKKQVEFMLKGPTYKEKNGEIDCEKLVEAFNKGSGVSTSDFKAILAVENFSLVIVFELRPSGGETAKQVGGSNSEFRRGVKLLQKAHGDKFYLQFLVWSDSFDAYVAARQVCDELGALAGWVPYNSNFIWKEGLGIAVNCQGKPPPPPPPTNPPPAQPTGPPPPPLPNDVID